MHRAARDLVIGIVDPQRIVSTPPAERISRGDSRSGYPPASLGWRDMRRDWGRPARASRAAAPPRPASARSSRGRRAGESVRRTWHPPSSSKRTHDRPWHERRKLRRHRASVNAVEGPKWRNMIVRRLELVGERGFEPPAPASRRQCSTRLSYSPTESGRDACGGRPASAWRGPIATRAGAAQALRFSRRARPAAPRCW